MLKRYDPCPFCGVSEQKVKRLYNSFLWLYNVLINDLGKSGEPPSVEERNHAVAEAIVILQELA